MKNWKQKITSDYFLFPVLMIACIWITDDQSRSFVYGFCTALLYMHFQSKGKIHNAMEEWEKEDEETT